MRRCFTASEIVIIRARAASGACCAAIACELHRAPQSVRAAARKRGIVLPLGRPPVQPFSESEINTIVSGCAIGFDAVHIARVLNRSPLSIRTFASARGLRFKSATPKRDVRLRFERTIRDQLEEIARTRFGTTAARLCRSLILRTIVDDLWRAVLGGANGKTPPTIGRGRNGAALEAPPASPARG